MWNNLPGLGTEYVFYITICNKLKINYTVYEILLQVHANPKPQVYNLIVTV